MALLVLVPAGLQAQTDRTLNLVPRLSDGTVGQPYAQTVLVSGGNAPYTFAKSGTLPTGLAWVPVNAGLLLTGTPTEPGVYSFSVSVTDANGQQSTKDLSVMVAGRRARAYTSNPTGSAITEGILETDVNTVTLGLNVLPASLPAGTAGTPYGPINFTAADGGATVTFSGTGTLPNGMSFTQTAGGLTLSGTPTQNNTYILNVSARDAAGHTGQSAYFLQINAPPPLALTPTSIETSLNVGDIYPTTQFAASGGSGNLTLSSSGSVPTGMLLTGTTGTNGAITGYLLTGYPTKPGSYTFTITASDANIPGSTKAQSYTIKVVMPHYDLSPGSFALATTGTAYSQSFSISGNPAGYTLTMTNAAGLPAGLSYAASGETVTISGTPATVAATANYGPFSFNLTDQYGNVETLGPIYLALKPAPLATIVVTTTPGSPLYSDEITINYAATGNYGPVPTGYISATLDNAYGPLVSTLANGAATLKVGRLTPGTHTLVYSYLGDSVYPGSSGNVTTTFVVSYPPYTLTGSFQVLNNQLGSSSYNAVDKNDILYLTEWQPNFNFTQYNNVLKYDPVNGNITTIDSTSFNQPHGIAVDNSENLYIADYGNKRVVELAPSGTKTVLPNLPSNIAPTAMALDTTQKNLWIVDTDNSRVVQYNLSSQQVTTTATGFSYAPLSVAVGADGTAYIGTTSSYTAGTLYSYTASVGLTALSTPGLVRFNGLVFDKVGNLYIDDGYNNVLWSRDAAGNLYELGVQISGPLAINSRGVIYSVDNGIVSFTPGPAGYAGTSGSQQGSYGGSFGGNFRVFFRSPSNTTLKTLTSPASSPYQPQYGMTAYSGFAYADLAEGAVLPGLQQGSITATFSDSYTLTSALYGTAANAELGFSPGNVTAATTNANTYGGLATDQVGNVYYTDTAANQVYSKVGGTISVVGFDNLSAPTQVAVDGTGAVFVLDSGTSRIIKRAASGLETVVYNLNTQLGNANPLASLTSFAMDGAGDLYLAGANNNGQGNSYGNGRIEMLSPMGQMSTFAINLVGVPTALALDSNSLLYSGDATGLVTEFTRSGAPGALATGLGSITSLAIEPSGTVYATTAASATLQRISPQGVVTPYAVASVTVASAVTVDKTGSLTVADNSTKLLYLDNRTTESFSFGPQVVGTSSAVQTTTLSNVGNTGGNTAGMQFTSLPGNANFQVYPGTTTCSTGTTSLAPGATCTLGMVFDPVVVGNDATTLSTHVNAPSQSTNTSTAYNSAFAGTGISTLPYANLPSGPLSFGVVGVGSGGTSTVVLSNGGGAALNIASIALSGNSAYSQTNNCGNMLASLASCNIELSFIANAVGTITATLTVTDNSNGNVGSVQTLALSSTGVASAPYVFIANGGGSVTSLFINGVSQSPAVAGGGIGVAVDRNGLVFSITADGSGVSTYADGGSIENTTSGVLTGASALAIDGGDQLWIAAPGSVSMGQIVGSGQASYTDTTLLKPSGVAIDLSGNVWISDSQSNTVHEIVGGGLPTAPLANAVTNKTPGTEPQ
jgi:sugar lactone lactonase YvrE